MDAVVLASTTRMPPNIASRRLRLALSLGLAFGLAGSLACTRKSGESASADKSAAESSDKGEASACPDAPIPETRAPLVEDKHDDPQFWLAKLDEGEAERELLDDAERAALAARVAELPGGWRDPVEVAVADPDLVQRELDERLAWLRERVASGKYVEGELGALDRAGERVEDSKDHIVDATGPALHFVTEETPLWCVPMHEGLFTEPVDRRFDRNRCASLHMGEYVRVIRETTAPWLYVDAGHSVGWIHAPEGESPLGPGLDADAVRERLRGPRLYVTGDHQGLRAGMSFPLLEAGDEGPTVLLPSVEGPVRAELPADIPVSTGPLPFTRRELFTQAFAELDQPYGWGGFEGKRDCSRFLHDLFAQFGVRLARNSAVQAQLGTRSVDLSELGEDEKRQAIREAAKTGVVLLYMRGHIMLYLGEDGGHDYGISALSEYLEPCAGGPDTVHKLDRVAVTSLELGRGSERQAFIERIDRMAVFE